VLQRALEATGLATVSISLVREHTEKLRPPRALFVPFPFGMPLGQPGDVDGQHRVLQCALELLREPAGPILRDYEGPDDASAPGSALQASAVEAHETEIDVATEVTAMRRYYEQWLAREGKTTVGVSGIPAVRFRGIVRFLEAFADGRDLDHPQRPSDVELPTFVRWCVDDLKAMYLEARFANGPPDERPEDRARWFWGETALATLLRRLRDRLEASDDPAMKRIAYGIAR
jgi:hypothetical protein